MGRPYTLRRRAERQAETRDRIVQAAFELHRTLGPSRTTINAIATRAGVSRPTVYAHFPDIASLFLACTAHGMAIDPPPDPSRWASPDPGERLRAALRDSYGYYGRNVTLLADMAAGRGPAPGLEAQREGMRARPLAIRTRLATGWGEPPERHPWVEAAVGHAIAFPTWRSLVQDQGLDEEDAIELMVAFVGAAAAG